jgi:curli biogenesis system outer membrane secretion channel CsgG
MTKKKKKCWEFNPENRPTFKEILNELTAYQRGEEELQGNNVTIGGEYTKLTALPKSSCFTGSICQQSSQLSTHSP